MSDAKAPEPTPLHAAPETQEGETVGQVTSLDKIGIMAHHTARVYQTLLLITGDQQTAMALTEITLRTIGPLAFNPGISFS